MFLRSSVTDDNYRKTTLNRAAAEHKKHH